MDGGQWEYESERLAYETHDEMIFCHSSCWCRLCALYLLMMAILSIRFQFGEIES